MNSDIEKLRYPNGPFQYERPLSAEERRVCLEKIRSFPKRLAEAVGSMSAEQLEQPYRPGGWTARQVIHHVADSHINAYVRFKLGLTEERPNIKAYDEKAWAVLPDSEKTPVSVSVALLTALHMRWSDLLEAMTPDDFRRDLFHPERGRAVALDEFLALYAWHGDHHLAHLALIG